MTNQLKGNEPILKIANGEIKQIKITLKNALLKCKTEDEVNDFLKTLTYIKEDINKIIK